MGTAAFLLKLQVVRIIEGFPAFLENDFFFMAKFADIFWNVYFFVKQCIDFQKQSVGGALKVFAKYFGLSNFSQKWEDDLEH